MSKLTKKIACALCMSAIISLATVESMPNNNNSNNNNNATAVIALVPANADLVICDSRIYSTEDGVKYKKVLTSKDGISWSK